MGMIGVLEITLIVPTLRVGSRSGRSASALERGEDARPTASVIHVMRSAH